MLLQLPSLWPWQQQQQASGIWRKVLREQLCKNRSCAWDWGAWSITKPWCGSSLGRDWRWTLPSDLGLGRLAFGLGPGKSARGREAPFSPPPSAAKQAGGGLINRRKQWLEAVECFLMAWTASSVGQHHVWSCGDHGVSSRWMCPAR